MTTIARPFIPCPFMSFCQGHSRRRGFALIGAVLLIPVRAWAAPPLALYGKSVVVSWKESRVQRRLSQADFYSLTVTKKMSIYISSAGRIFSRQTSTNFRGSGSTEQIAGERGNGRNMDLIPTFTGNSMVLFGGPSQGAVRRISLTFDSGFTSCSANVVFGKQSGRMTFRAYSPIVNEYIEIASASASDATCSIRSGNVFAGE
jgi:hypothetical protein